MYKISAQVIKMHSLQNTGTRQNNNKNEENKNEQLVMIRQLQKYTSKQAIPDSVA